MFGYPTCANRSERKTLREPLVYVCKKAFFDRVSKELSIEKLADYSSLRRYLSLEDMAFQLAMWRLVSNKLDICLDNFALYRIATDGELVEYNNSIQPFSLDPLLIKQVEYFLKPSLLSEKSSEIDSIYSYPGSFLNKEDSDDIKVPYRVVTFGTSLYILVEEGFLDHLSDKLNVLKFYTEVLKAAYSVATINDVNQSPWFEQYLKALSESV